MAIIRRRNFGDSDGRITGDDMALIDTPGKLLRFAQSKNLSVLPLAVERLAKEFGIEVTYNHMKDDVSGLLRRDPARDVWMIEVNEDHHPNRQRYTIAHELAHYCLHRHLKNEFVDEIFFRGGHTSKVEWQANQFASEILMPEETVRELVRSGTRKVDELAERLKVSTLALRIRAKNLGMSGHGL